MLRSKYPISPEMVRDWDKISKINDDNKRAEVIATYYAEYGTLKCFLPYDLLDAPSFLESYLRLSAKEQRDAVSLEAEECREYIDHKSKVKIMNETNLKFIKNILLPAYKRINFEDQIKKCDKIIKYHEITKDGILHMSLDDIEKEFNPVLLRGRYD